MWVRSASGWFQDCSNRRSVRWSDSGCSLKSELATFAERLAVGIWGSNSAHGQVGCRSVVPVVGPHGMGSSLPGERAGRS